MVLDQYLSTYTHDYLWPCNLTIPKRCTGPRSHLSIVPSTQQKNDCVCTMKPAEYLELLRKKYSNLDEILNLAPPAIGVRKRRWPPGHKIHFMSRFDLTPAERAPLYQRPKDKPFPCDREQLEVHPGNLKSTSRQNPKIPRRLSDNVLITVDPMEDTTEYRATHSKLGQSVLDARIPPPLHPPIQKIKSCTPV